MEKHWATKQSREAAKKAATNGKWLESLFQNSKDPIVFADVNGNLQALNRAFEDLTGYSRDELVEQKTFMEITPKKYASFEARLVRRVIETGVSAEFEKEYIRKDGSHIPILLNAFVVKNEADELIGTGAILKDLTERKRAEKHIRESEYRFNKSQEVAHLGSWELDLIDNVLTWSDEEYRIFGLEPQEFGATYEAFLETVHPDDREAVDNAYSGSIREGRDTYEIEHRVARKHTGETRIVHEKCQHFRDENGKIIRSVGMTDDITDRKQAEELSDALNEINTAISSTLDIDEIIRRVIEEARQVMDSETALLTLRENNEWVVKHIDGQLSKDLIGARFTEDQVRGMVLAVKTGKPFVAGDVDHEVRLNSEFLRRYSVRSCMAVPLVIKENMLGTIVFMNHSAPKAFTKNQIDFSEKLAVSVSLAVQNAQSHKITQHALSDANALHRLATLITQTLELSDVLKAALAGALATASTEYGCIYLIDKAGNLVIGTQSQLSQAFLEAKGTLAPGQGCAGRAAKTKEIFAPTPEENEYTCEESKNLLGLDCLAAVPLVARGRTLGVLELFAPVQRRLSNRERRMVLTMADQLATAVENARLYSKQRNIANTLQETFLTVPEEIKGLDFGHLYRAAMEVAKVGGDFFDLFELEENKVCILIGDVSGKGLEAAKMTSMMKNTIHAHSHEETSPAKILEKTNKSACRTIPPGSFITVFLGVLNTTTGVLTYCNAGHLPPIVRRATGRSSLLAAGNIPIGALEEVDYRDRKVRLKDNDLLFAYTDGLIEARHDTKFYGEKRLRKAVKELASIPAPNLPRAIFDQVLEFTDGKLVDDIAILAVSLKRKGESNW